MYEFSSSTDAAHKNASSVTGELTTFGFSYLRVKRNTFSMPSIVIKLEQIN